MSDAGNLRHLAEVSRHGGSWGFPQEKAASSLRPGAPASTASGSTERWRHGPAPSAPGAVAAWLMAFVFRCHRAARARGCVQTGRTTGLAADGQDKNPCHHWAGAWPAYLSQRQIRKRWTASRAGAGPQGQQDRSPATGHRGPGREGPGAVLRQRPATRRRGPQRGRRRRHGCNGAGWPGSGPQGAGQGGAQGQVDGRAMPRPGDHRDNGQPGISSLKVRVTRESR